MCSIKTAKPNFNCKKQCRNCKLKEQVHLLLDVAIIAEKNYELNTTIDKNKRLYEKESVSLKSFLLM